MVLYIYSLLLGPLAYPYIPSKLDLIPRPSQKSDHRPHVSGALLVELIGNRFGLCANQLAAVHLERMARLVRGIGSRSSPTSDFLGPFYHQILICQISLNI